MKDDSPLQSNLVGLTELFYSALKDYSTTHKEGLEELSFSDSVKAIKVATVLFMRDECQEDLAKMDDQFGLKSTTYYTYRRLANEWGIDGCVGKLPPSPLKPSSSASSASSARPSKVLEEEPLGTLNDLDLDISGLMTIEQGVADLEDEAQGKDLEEQMDIFTAPLPPLLVASDQYQQHLLEKLS